MRNTAISLLLLSFAAGVFGSVGYGLTYGTAEWRASINGKSVLAEAEGSRQVLIQQASAEKEAATLQKDRDIIRAQGIAEANRIINESLSEEYIRWLYVEGLKDSQNQIIYIPTEAGLPVLEAGKR